MKWFKHDTDAHRSEGLAAIRAQFGYEGIGWWFTILEMVAEKMDETDRCHLELPLKDWCSALSTKPQKLRTYLDVLSQNCRTSVSESEKFGVSYVSVSIPNLLKKRDEHTRKLRSDSGLTPELARANTKSQEKEKEPEPDQSPQTPLALTPSPALAEAGPGRAEAVETLGNGKAGAVSIAQALAGVSVNRPDPDEWERWKREDLKRVLAEQRAAAQAEREAEAAAKHAHFERDAVNWADEFADLVPNCDPQTKASMHAALKAIGDNTKIQQIYTNARDFVQSGQARNPAKLILHRLRNP